MADSLSKHQLEIWRTHGPVVQAMVVDRIDGLPMGKRAPLLRLLARMLGEVLEAEIMGASSSSSSITMHFGPVPASVDLRAIRGKAMKLLKELMQLATSDGDRRTILSALENATQGPRTDYLPNDLAKLLIDNTKEFVKFLTEIAPTLGYEILQTWEDRARWMYIHNRSLPEALASDAVLVEARDRLVAAIFAFRDAINCDRAFVIYKTLVGFESVFPPAWDDPIFDLEEADRYRAAQVEALLGEIDEANADQWFEILFRCARTESDDLATFPTFGRFLTRLGETKPDILIGYIGKMKPPLARFLPAMLTGLMKSDRKDAAEALIEQWLVGSRYLSDIAWYCRFADTCEENLLIRVLERAVANNDNPAVLNMLAAAETQFRSNPGTLIETAFLPAVRHAASQKDLHWVSRSVSWMNSPILRALDQGQARIVLEALVPYPKLEREAEYVAAAIAKQWSGAVIEFLGDRQSFGDDRSIADGYRAFPSRVYALRKPLAAASDALIRGRRWFELDSRLFRFGAGRFLASIFPGLPTKFRDRLAEYVAGGDRQDIAFVLAIVSNYTGEEAPHGFLKDIVAQIDPNDDLVGSVAACLDSTGVVAGEFGMVEFFTQQKASMQDWFDDPRDRVRVFAEARIRSLDHRIIREQRMAETSIAMRKLDFGEELDDEA